MVIKVLGTGCSNCKKLKENAAAAVKALGINAEIVAVDAIADIMAYGVMKTPALVVDEEVKIVGKVASQEDIMKVLQG